METAGFGGSCHWCTEAVFLSLKGVTEVEQGWISGEDAAGDFSEAVLVRFDPEVISLQALIGIHLHTHSSTSEHTMRSKYRSAIYVFSELQELAGVSAMKTLQDDFESRLITTVVRFREFRKNESQYLNYYFNNPDKPFCQTYIQPKLRLLMEKFPGQTNRKNNLTPEQKKKVQEDHGTFVVGPALGHEK